MHRRQERRGAEGLSPSAAITETPGHRNRAGAMVGSYDSDTPLFPLLIVFVSATVWSILASAMPGPKPVGGGLDTDGV
jgi:hypothetical protein